MINAQDAYLDTLKNRGKKSAISITENKIKEKIAQGVFGCEIDFTLFTKEEIERVRAELIANGYWCSNVRELIDQREGPYGYCLIISWSSREEGR